MLHHLANNWWLFALRGCFALLFGATALALVTMSRMYLVSVLAFTTLVLLFGVLAAGVGILTALAALWGAGKDRHWWFLLVDGVAAFAVGVIVVVSPDLTLGRLVRLMALWALVIGVCELAAGYCLKKHLADEWMLAGGGVLSLAFGAYLLLGPPRDPGSILQWLGGYALFSSASMIALAFRLRLERAQFIPSPGLV